VHATGVQEQQFYGLITRYASRTRHGRESVVVVPLPSADVIDALLSEALCGQPAPWPWDAGAAIDAVFARARLHGVIALVNAQPSTRKWPGRFVELCRAEAQALAMWELRHQAVLGQTLRALADEGTKPLLIKGTALGYSLYDDPVQRTRADTDLLIPPLAAKTAERTLLRLGFDRVPSAPSYQATYILRLTDGTSHALDVHWRINNSELLARLLPYEELTGSAQPVAALGTHALAPSLMHSLLIACMHRATHRHNPYHVAGESHHEPDRLIWLRDIDLLARALTKEQWRELGTAATTKGLSATCLEGLQLAARSFHTPLPANALKSLSGTPGRADRYLQSRPVRQHWLDFLAFDSMRARARWMRDIALPPEPYMRTKYPGGGGLPWLYLRRAAAGVAKRLHL